MPVFTAFSRVFVTKQDTARLSQVCWSGTSASNISEIQGETGNRFLFFRERTAVNSLKKHHRESQSKTTGAEVEAAAPELFDKLGLILALSRKPRNTEQLQNKEEPDEARKQK